MPELPEVQTIAADLHEALAGRVFREVRVRLPKIVAGDPERFRELTQGARVESVERFGKWIVFNLNRPAAGEPQRPVAPQRAAERSDLGSGPDRNGRSKNRVFGSVTGPVGEAVLLAHLKMTGQFHLGAWPEDEAGWAKHDHAAFRLAESPAERETLFYRDMRQFGRLRAFERAEFESFRAALGLGPDPLAVDPEDFHRRLTARRGRLKGVLLDQTTVAGLGNIYVDESLFAAGLSPARPAAGLSRAETDRLLGECRLILAQAIAERGSTTSNYQGLKGGGSYQKSHQVYGRGGEPCPRCGRALEKSVVAGRSTCHCPHCQKNS